MSASGLENLFTEAFRVDQLLAPVSAVPIWALSWFLNSYVAELPAEVAERLREGRSAVSVTAQPWFTG